jgi:hypothetical protein
VPTPELAATFPAQPDLQMPVAHHLRLPHLVIVRAPGLLPMWYSLCELAQELGISIRSIRGWLDQGLPCRRDERGHLWIDGRQFAAWVKAINIPRARQSLQSNEAYCLGCRRPVRLLNLNLIDRGKQRLLKGTCAECGQVVCRAVRHG